VHKITGKIQLGGVLQVILKARFTSKLDQFAMGLMWLSCGSIQGWTSQNFSEQPAPGFHRSHGEELLPHAQLQFPLLQVLTLCCNL